MIVGSNNYLIARGKKKATVYLVRYSSDGKKKRGEIYIGAIMFPEHCIGKKVRVKVEFLEAKNDV
jgi:hypothetical protein